MLEGLYFNYDGINSQDMGLYNVKVDSGLFEEPFLADRTIIETKIARRDTPYFHAVEREPYRFEVSFFFEDTYDSDKIRAVARWLNQDYYKPFYTSDNPNRIYYCMPEQSSSLIHNGLKQGYITLTMRCDSPYAYSPIYLSEKFTVQNGDTPTVIMLDNLGDVNIYPEMWIYKDNTDGDVSIINTTNGNAETIIYNVYNNETVYIDNENEHIESDIPDLYRYDTFNHVYLELVRGTNILHVTGGCEIQFRYQYKLLQG